MRIERLACALALPVLLALPCVAQEPLPVRLGAASFAQPDGVQLDYAWRFARDDAAGRESPALDDSHWQHIRPALRESDLPAASWSGTGWFRRHVIVEPALDGRPLALRVTAPGIAAVYLDGRPVVTVGQSTAAAQIPAQRSDVVVVRLRGPAHLLAVRYAYPRQAPRPAEGIGFVLSLTDAAAVSAPAGPSNWVIAIKGAMVALPLFLSLFHLALFAFDRRARENLFYAAQMVTFAMIVLNDYRDTFFGAEAQRELVDRWSRGTPPLAVLFVLLTYYAVRVHPYPRSRRLFIAAGVLLCAWSYVVTGIGHYGWIIYFAAVVIEIIRMERSKRNIRAERVRGLLVSFAVAGVAITIQVLINFGVLQSVGGLREVYLFGIGASAVGMSLYLARRMERSRTIESENERKTLELTRAREIQLSMLPRQLPQVASLDVAAASLTATEVGGDYYDVRRAGDGELMIAVGDATGHGLAAGIVVTAAKALFNSLPPERPVSDLLERCDEALRAMQLPKLRMCLALARVSPTEMSMASAAMPPALVYRAATAGVQELGDSALPLGGRLANRPREQRVDLEPGDTILFSSDGLAELRDSEGRQLGYDAATDLFRQAARSDTAEKVIDQLTAAAASFRNGHPLDDDLTLVVVRVMA